MRRRFLAIAVFGLLFISGRALAQTGSSSGSNAGSSSSGSSSSSMSVHTTGPASVGVVSGTVSGGSTASGGSSNTFGSGGGGSSGGGAGVAAADASAPSAAQDGVVRRVDLPALRLGGTRTASGSGPDVVTWGIAAIIIVGLVVLYRRLPRPTRA